MLEPLDRSADPVATATSTAEGRFTMLDLDPGRYNLKGARNGYLQTSYGAKRPDGKGTIIQLDRGQCPGELMLKLTPFGVIAGTVRDSDGEALADARHHRTFEFGKPRVDGFDSTDTNDLGEYRFRNLSPGEYYISTEPPATEWRGEVDRASSDQPVYASVPTIYPGVQDLGAATSIEVSSGARISGIDVTLLRTRVFNISGRVTLPGGAGANRVSLTLTDLRTLKDHQLRTATKNGDGDFELRGVASGSYRLDASAESLSGSAPVEISAVNLSGVRVQLGLEAMVKTKVTVEGEKKPHLSEQRLVFRSGGNQESLSDVIVNDTFSASLSPGNYRIDIETVWPRGFFVKSIRSGDFDVLADGLTIRQPGAMEVEITLASDGGKLDGVVQPPSAATVVLVPARRDREDLFQNHRNGSVRPLRIQLRPAGRLQALRLGRPGARLVVRPRLPQGLRKGRRAGDSPAQLTPVR